MQAGDVVTPSSSKHGAIEVGKNNTPEASTGNAAKIMSTKTGPSAHQKMEGPKLITKVSSLFDGGIFSRSSSLDPTIIAKLAPTKTCLQTLKYKQKTLQVYPGLSIEQFSVKNHGRNLILQGANSIKAEIVDMITMGRIMEEKSRQLSHAAVDRFFDWLSLFALYVERYFFVEEEVVIAWIIAKAGPLKGELKNSARKLRRGKLQKLLIDIVNLHDDFPPSLPAGERIGRLTCKLGELASQVMEYFDIMLLQLPDLINRWYNRSSTQKLRRKLVNYVMTHVGSEDFLVLNTRWMRAKELRDWKLRILLPSEFKYFAYTIWQNDMQCAHFDIVTTFAETLDAEIKGDAVSSSLHVTEIMKMSNTARPRQDDFEEEEEEDDDYDDDREQGNK